VLLPGYGWSLTSLAAGADGSLWATICASDRSDYCTEPDLMRWDGTWAPVPYPGMRPVAVAVSADGALWATLAPRGGPEAPRVLARYAQGTWSTYPDAPSLQGPVLAPDGAICGVGAGAHDVHCVDGTGAVRSVPIGVPGTISMGGDGSVWIADRGQLAHLLSPAG
jgi:streptogramin lyase